MRVKKKKKSTKLRINSKPLLIACPIAAGDLLRLLSHSPSSPSFTSPKGVSSKKINVKQSIVLIFTIKYYNFINL